MKRICVYSGSSSGINKEYSKFARLLGKELVKNNIDLVYGGSKTGLMGDISDEVFKNNGKVIGIIPQIPLLEEKTSKNLTKLIKVKNMSERKEKMSDLSDGFVALPGGLGTYEELFDTLSWARIGIHQKPIGLLNISNYFDPLIYMLENSYKEGFISKLSMKLLLISDNPCELINSMKISCRQQIKIRKS
ncbi:TIGR00730 family Rossman fold protein [Clostridium tyrobutyricum]|uniref:LOG family protein n=1 Tax=Clostridium tyrobutyricum TaxID=1519 RepID=UPI001C38838E|nr:TIGR00730 family Rossman fold protein [Clostridium tyrobutyricum]MBV4439943.1 TIGR00730 family Rossman fold protein [Clostridium tyrobutyricum]